MDVHFVPTFMGPRSYEESFRFYGSINVIEAFLAV